LNNLLRHAARPRRLAKAAESLLRERLEDCLLDTRAWHRFAMDHELAERLNASWYRRKEVEALFR